MLIRVMNNSGAVYEVKIEYFLKNFFNMMLYYVPNDGVIGLKGDMQTLSDLFYDLSEESSYLSYKYFVLFHALNYELLPYIYWELLYV